MASSSPNHTGNEGFDFWMDEYSSKIKDIENALHQEDSDTTDLVHAATKILRNLHSEARGISKSKDPALRQEMMDVYKACKMQLETYRQICDQKGLFQQQQQQQQHNQSSSSAAQSSAVPSASFLWNNNTQRAQVQANTQGRVAQQNSTLQSAMQSLRESEEISQEIMGELRGQRETLEHTRSSMNSMKDMTQQAKGLLMSMNKPWWMKW